MPCRAGLLPPAKAEALWQEYVSRQVLFAEVLMSLGQLDRRRSAPCCCATNAARSASASYMVGLGLISQAALHEALELQRTLQGSIYGLLEREGVLAHRRRDV